MATMFRQESLQSIEKACRSFAVDAELKKHAWRPYMAVIGAEEALLGKPTFTYLVRPCDYDRGFMISFVNKDGNVAHDHFTYDPIYGIWRNSCPSHVGELEKVLRDMMHCAMHEGQPLS